MDVLKEPPATSPDRTGSQDPQGPDGSFERFYADEAPGVLALAHALSGSRWAAEEITQDAFLAAHQRWPEVRQLDLPRAWLRRVAVNMCASHTRRRVAEAKALARLRGRGRSPVPDIDAADARLWAAIRSLPRRQAVAAVLFYVEDQSIAQIAQHLGCAQGTVKAHLHRARHALASKLGIAEPKEDGT